MEIYRVDPRALGGTPQQYAVEAQPFDSYESLIWTDRFQEDGDFELLTPNTRAARRFFIKGSWIIIQASKRMMIVETLLQETRDGVSMLKVSGRSAESVYHSRFPARVQFVGGNIIVLGTNHPFIWSTGVTPVGILNDIADHALGGGLAGLGKVFAGVDPMDNSYNITFWVTVAHPDTFPPNNIPEPPPLAGANRYLEKTTSVRTHIIDIGKEFGLGHRITYSPIGNNIQLFADTYTGVDRTSYQEMYPPIVFAPSLNTLDNTTGLDTLENSYNVCMVSHKGRTIFVTDLGVDGDISGPDRRVMQTTISAMEGEGEETWDNPVLLERMEKVGLSELAKHRAKILFDGEVNAKNPYVYGEDYNVGDLVDIQDFDGNIYRMRVTEQIFNVDGEGTRTFPTLEREEIVTTDVWKNWPGVWTDPPANVEWKNA